MLVQPPHKDCRGIVRPALEQENTGELVVGRGMHGFFRAGHAGERLGEFEFIDVQGYARKHDMEFSILVGNMAGGFTEGLTRHR